MATTAYSGGRRRDLGDAAFHAVNYAIMIALSFLTIYPFLFLIQQGGQIQDSFGGVDNVL